MTPSKSRLKYFQIAQKNVKLIDKRTEFPLTRKGAKGDASHSTARDR